MSASAPSERVFSVRQHILSPRRSKLSDILFNILMTLNLNKKFMKSDNKTLMVNKKSVTCTSMGWSGLYPIHPNSWLYSVIAYKRLDP